MKTKASERYIVIDDFLVGELRRWKHQQSENEDSAGNSYVYIYCSTENKMIQQSKSLATEYNRAEMVCTRIDGHAVLKNMLSKIFKDEGINAHSFRHTHVTTSIENGATPKGVAGRLGHSNIFITQNLYTQYEKVTGQHSGNFYKNLADKSITQTIRRQIYLKSLIYR